MTIAERVKCILIENLGSADEEVTDDASLENDLGADSLDVFELVLAFEEDFRIEIPDEDAECIKTVRDVVRYVESKVNR